ncbi:hypothetical protein O2W15_05710 [Modestobacter sp. VKM Ac-2979]|uniref:hypothetical protein n=1 Tax=unclassified Modestobacter TaxID=2643866 RepID=UPI0022AB531D|nr:MULTISPECIES: hypothetical protein [unclassified Modestobacter]MCZ2810924.1 hypothetical protein [Modestobacter sp. VKM Ac-2979]MCZ2840437.1 hypothetical protein [Modestobacter sp. VKM Ac-2980]
MQLRRPPLVVPSLLVALALLAGCGDDETVQRVPGDPVTTQEAEVLGQVLAADLEEGGADFEVTAPYAEGAVLTLTGEIDFAEGIGRAQAVTSYADGRPEDTRTLFFTGEDLWQGDVPGLAEALEEAGLPPATYVRRPITTTQAGGTASLLDVLVQMVPKLAAPTADDPRSFAGYTWAGSQSINGELASVFQNPTGTTIAVAAESELLVQYSTTLQDVPVTITLADHGEREITLPADSDTVSLAEHPDLAAALGL